MYFYSTSVTITCIKLKLNFNKRKEINKVKFGERRSVHGKFI